MEFPVKPLQFGPTSPPETAVAGGLIAFG